VLIVVAVAVIRNCALGLVGLKNDFSFLNIPHAMTTSEITLIDHPLFVASNPDLKHLPVQKWFAFMID